MMKKYSLATAIVLTLSSQAFAAQTTVCTHGKDERKVEVTSDTAPCEVKYYKGDGEGKVIFSAQNDAGYCATKAKEFSEKLGSMGYNCDGSETVSTAKKEETTTTTETKTETKEAAPTKTEKTTTTETKTKK